MNALCVLYIFCLNIFLINTYPESALEDNDRECIRTLNLTAEFVVNSFDRYNLMIEGNPDLNKFVNCTWTKSGYLTKDGNINPDTITTWIKTDLNKILQDNHKINVRSFVDQCKLLKGEGPGDTAIKATHAQSFTENDLDEADLHCIKELGIRKEDVVNAYDKNDFIREGDAQVNKFFECAWKKDKLQATDGSINEINLQKAIELLLEHRKNIESAKHREVLSKQGIELCRKVKGSDDGDTCVKLYNCLLTKILDVISSFGY
ncbi:hypothetical protein FQA39_LY04241 [Lamprigera yunnana]|nr:hypothetical protein FQA39_LY04241 [Lamprigera yunnana]